jgi:hypothetical protein
MDRAAHVLPVRVANRVIHGEGLIDTNHFHSSLIKCAATSTFSLSTPASLALAQIGHHAGPGVARHCTFISLRWPLNDGQNWRLRGPPLTCAMHWAATPCFIDAENGVYRKADDNSEERGSEADRTNRSADANGTLRMYFPHPRALSPPLGECEWLRYQTKFAQ